MNKMLLNSNLLFVSDEKRRTENLTRKSKLPLFHRVVE